jgi:predicted nucleic acid-binding protein
LKVYADSSFLVSLYSLDAHSSRATANVRRLSPELLLTPLSEFELTNGLQLRVFRNESSVAEISDALTELQQHVESGFYKMVGMPATVYELARRIAFKRTAIAGTRALDVLHVASAILLNAEEFWTFDNRQAKVAKAEGLQLR